MGTALNPKSTRASSGRSDRSSPKPRRKPVPSKPSRTRTGARREACEPVPIEALRKIHAELERICSTAIVVAHALKEQNAVLDGDAADVLRWHVNDPLFEQILRLKRIVAGGPSS